MDFYRSKTIREQILSSDAFQIFCTLSDSLVYHPHLYCLSMLVEINVTILFATKDSFVGTLLKTIIFKTE
ncbi:hypothetical protein T4E_5938 [Trichinella pseudospiralis]|uniref:Uncharacterized protein n=1 Tax=Trichinella pseudospiralis TaxID=6337 RepID=A0A0V0YKC1_TRIPS|nr:hypothetical protein T4E_5938 [Trichinella pseudospiralis]KRY91685.1 hypothetical protein T4D_14010 [Trichinella pseudospiralis]